MLPTFLPAFEELECFAAAARLLNFRAAADAVSLTPAALSKRIASLEQRLGKRLFERTTRRVALTEAGHALLPFAHAALRAAEEGVRAARGEAGPPPLDIVLGTRHELGLSWVVPLLPKLEAEHAHVTFHLYFGAGPDLEARVRSSDIDAAVTSRPLADPRIVGVQLHREEYALVGARALIEKEPLEKAEDAREHVLLDAGRELPLFRYWRDAPGGGDRLDFRRVRCLGTVAAIHRLVLAKAGVAVLPVYVIDRDLAAKRLVRIFPDVEPLHDHFRLIFRADDPRRTTLEAIAETLRAAPLR